MKARPLAVIPKIAQRRLAAIRTASPTPVFALFRPRTTRLGERMSFRISAVASPGRFLQTEVLPSLKIVSIVTAGAGILTIALHNSIITISACRRGRPAKRIAFARWFPDFSAEAEKASGLANQYERLRQNRNQNPVPRDRQGGRSRAIQRGHGSRKRRESQQQSEPHGTVPSRQPRRVFCSRERARERSIRGRRQERR